MTDLWQGLTKFSLVFSIALLTVALLRPLLRRLGGATAQYQGWLLVLAVLLASHLPAPRPEAQVGEDLPEHVAVTPLDGEIGVRCGISDEYHEEDRQEHAERAEGDQELLPGQIAQGREDERLPDG